MERYFPDPVTRNLSLLPVAPLSPELRADFARTCLAFFAGRRGYDRLACVALSAPLEYGRGGTYLKGLLLVLTCFEHWESFEGYEKLAKIVFSCGAHKDPTFLRLAELCSDILDWGASSREFEEFVQVAWPTLCEEWEYEHSENDVPVWERAPGGSWLWVGPSNDFYHKSAYTKAEASRVARKDQRRPE